MVGQLLRDIVEAAERPPAAAAAAAATSSCYDRFGFRVPETAEPSLEEKAERLRRQAEDASDHAIAEVTTTINAVQA